MRGARLEALLRGRIQWGVEIFEEGIIKIEIGDVNSEARRGNTKGLWGHVPVSPLQQSLQQTSP